MGRRLTPEEKAENLRKKEAFDLRMDAYWAEAKARYEQECRAISESLDPKIESLRVETERMSREYDTARLNASREVNNAFPDLKGVSHWRNWIEPK